MGRFVVGVSGASGVILAQKLIQALIEKEFEVELIFSQYALYTASIELGKQWSTASKFTKQFPLKYQKLIRVHAIQDVGCAVASGSYKTDGMMIIPCSMATVAAVAMGLSDNALRRAADVTLKEKRPLVVVPREAPLSELHLENLLKLARLGATVIPPVPAWYTEPKTLDDVENFIVGRVLDAFQVEHTLYKRWEPLKAS